MNWLMLAFPLDYQAVNSVLLNGMKIISWTLTVGPRLVHLDPLPLALQVQFVFSDMFFALLLRHFRRLRVADDQWIPQRIVLHGQRRSVYWSVCDLKPYLYSWSVYDLEPYLYSSIQCISLARIVSVLRKFALIFLNVRFYCRRQSFGYKIRHWLRQPGGFQMGYFGPAVRIRCHIHPDCAHDAQQAELLNVSARGAVACKISHDMAIIQSSQNWFFLNRIDFVSYLRSNLPRTSTAACFVICGWPCSISHSLITPDCCCYWCWCLYCVAAPKFRRSHARRQASSSMSRRTRPFSQPYCHGLAVVDNLEVNFNYIFSVWSVYFYFFRC